MTRNSEKIFQADRSLYMASLAADNVDCLAIAMQEEEMDEQIKANALRFTSFYLREELAKATIPLCTVSISFESYFKTEKTC